MAESVIYIRYKLRPWTKQKPQHNQTEHLQKILCLPKFSISKMFSFACFFALDSRIHLSQGQGNIKGNIKQLLQILLLRKQTKMK